MRNRTWQEMLLSDSFTITEFCAAERMCRATFYKLLRTGLGPEVMLIGTDKRISAAARQKWQRRMERLAKAGRRRTGKMVG